MRNDDGGVGYGKPPKHTQFKSGQCGNRNGRPKGVLSLATVVERTMREKVILNENGRRKRVTKLEAAIKQLVNKSATGDMHALRMLLTLARSAEEQTAAQPYSASELSEMDQKIMSNLLKRFGLNHKEEAE